jgi:hypothetical protein
MRTPRLVSPAQGGASHRGCAPAIHAVNHHGVAFAHEGQQRSSSGRCVSLPDALSVNTLPLRLLQLPFRVLVEAADADVADALTLQDASQYESVRKKSMTFPVCVNKYKYRLYSDDIERPFLTSG